MDRISVLQARRAGNIDAMQALLASIPEGDDMTAEQTVTLQGYTALDDGYSAELVVLRDVERRQAAAAVPVAALPGSIPAAMTVPAVAANPDNKGTTFARMVRMIGAAGGNSYVAQQMAEANGDSGLFANQNMSTGVNGGFLVPEDVAAEVIELLRPASVVMAMGPRVVPMPNGNMTQNRRVTGSTFGYQGEQQDAGATGVEFGQVKLSAKKLTGLIPISNDLLRSSSTAVDRLIRDDMVADASVAMDRYFIRGLGTENAPKGLRYQTAGTAFEASHVFEMTAAPTLAKVDADLGKMELALGNANINYTEAHWLMAPGAAMYLTNLRDGNGNKVYPEMSAGMLRMKPVHITTQIPQNLGGGAESEILLVAPAHILVGEHMGIEVAISTEAAYKDAAGTMQAAFSRDETLMRMIMQHDIGARHLAAIAVLTGVTWAPGI